MTIGTQARELIIDTFRLLSGGAEARIGGGGSTLHIMSTGLSAPVKSTSVRHILLVRREIVAVVVADTALDKGWGCD